MESAFAWLGQIFDAILQFFPRRVIVRATHAGVKWRWRGEPIELKPGVRWYWPLLSEVELHVVARQTVNTRTQALVTKDNRQVVVGGVVIYSINDIVQAIGKLNWMPDDTVRDIAQAAIVKEVVALNYDEMLDGIADKVETDLTARCRKMLRQYGIYVHRAALTDFSPCKTFNLLGVTPPEQIYRG
jgi:regulator of protease activity HflC (stomatin/prohibitin superfamily)